MAMTFLQQRLTSVSSRLLLVLGVGLLPLLLFVLASAHWQPGPAPAAAVALPVAVAGSDTPLLQSTPVAMASAGRSLPDAAPQALPLALNLVSVLALAAVGLVAAWALGRKLLVLPAPAAPAPGFRSVAAVASGGVGVDASGVTLFHQFADAMPQLVSIMHPDGASTYVNQRWADYLGVPRGEILAHGWSRFLHPDDLPRVSTLWADAARRGESVELEYRLRRADGCYRWMLSRAVRLATTGAPGADGARAGEWLMTSTDIDDLKGGAVVLEKDMSLKRLVGRMAKVGGWTIGLPDRTLTWSPENCLIHDVPVGYQPTLDEGIGYFLPEHRSVVAGYVDACMADGTPYDFVLPKHTARQRLIWVRSIGEAVKNEAGQIIGLQGAFQDVTEQKEAEQRSQALTKQLNDTLEARVKQRTAQLESANKELESFAYAVSHDLRSPLNTIAGFVPLLLRAESEHLSEKGRHYLSRIGAGVTQMGQLISGLLTLAHVSREQPRLDALDLTAIAQRTAAFCRQRQPWRAVHITIDAGLSAQGDPRLIDIVLEQLIGNAWKFSSPRAEALIDISSQPGTNGDTVFFVRDNGVGFDMAFQHKLFGTFERLHSPGEFEGTGIGLATVKRVIDNHGGRIWAESRVGGGATFYFTLGSQRSQRQAA